MSPQSSIGHYRIVSKLGEGGMGAVYRATDTKLGRDVAIKVLPPAFAEDAARMARFEREAQVLASLNHPNIAAIYGVEQGALVMELVEGGDLKGPVPLDMALDYARQIAAGLEAAHEKGIVHRDLKPANIKVTPEGVVKLLDFGLAKASEKSQAEACVTQSLTMTQAGVILGTAAYMSPEQARGKPVDKRADIWAFGVVLYELLTGKPLFAAGDTLTDVIAAVVTREPEFAAVHERVRPLLKACLEKDPRQRLRDIGDWQRLLAEAAPAPAVVPSLSRHGSAWMGVGGILAVALAAVAGFGWWRASRVPEPLPMRFHVDLGDDAYIGSENPVRISPDGSRLLYTVLRNGEETLVTRVLSENKVTPLAATTGAAGTENATEAFFSGDGQWIGFLQKRELRKIPVEGGAVSSLHSDVSAAWCDWDTAGTLVCANPDTENLYVVTPSGTARTLALTKRIPWDPHILPGGKDVLLSALRTIGDFGSADIDVVSLADGSSRTIYHGGYGGRYVPSGHLLYLQRGSLLAVRFDLKSMRPLGSPVVVADDVGANELGIGQFDISQNGTLVYVPGTAGNGRAPLSWMDSTGKTTPILPPGDYMAPALSPDGRHLAYTLQTGTSSDVWVYDLARETATQLTFHATRSPMELAWSPDGKHLVYGAETDEGSGLWWVRADGSGGAQRLLLDPKLPLRPQSFSPDGRILVYSSSPGDYPDLWTLPLDLADPEHPKAGTPQPYLTTPVVEVDGVLSPDGRWMAYASSESGREELFVRPFPLGSNGGGKFRISSDGGKFPSWSPAGHELFFLGADDRIMVTEYRVKGQEFENAKPHAWCGTPIFRTTVIRSLALAPDGKRFVVFPRQAEQKGPAHVNFVVNFFEELRHKAPVK